MLDAASFSIGAAIKAFAFRPGLVAAAWDDGLDSAAVQELPQRVVAVALVAGQLEWPADAARPPHGVHYLAELRGFVRLARGERGPEDKALAVSNQVEL